MNAAVLKTPAFKIGDAVLIPRNGIAVISDRKTIKVADIEDEFFFTELKMLISTLKKTNPVVQVSVKHAAKRLTAMPTMDELNEILAIAAANPKPRPGIWSRVAKSHEDSLKSGNLYLIASVYRDTKSETLEEQSPRSLLNDEAKLTLTICFATIHGMDLDTASREIRKILRPEEEVAPAPEAIEEEKEADVPPEQISLGLPIDENKINFEKPKTKEIYEDAQKVFAQRPNDLVVYVYAHLYKPEHREAACEAYAKTRNISHTTEYKYRKNVRDVYEMHASVEIPADFYYVSRSHTHHVRPEADIKHDFKNAQPPIAAIDAVPAAQPKAAEEEALRPLSDSLKALPLHIIFKASLFDPQVEGIIKTHMKLYTIGQIFDAVSRPSWSNAAKTTYHLNEDQAERVKTSVFDAIRNVQRSLS